MDGGDVNMENVGQAPHLERIILQNGTQQLVDSDRAMLPAPDIDADTHGVRRLLHGALAQRRADLDER